MNTGAWGIEVRGTASPRCADRASGATGDVAPSVGLAHAPPRRHSGVPTDALSVGGGTCFSHRGGPQSICESTEGIGRTKVHVDNRELLAREIIDFILEMRAAAGSQQ